MFTLSLKALQRHFTLFGEESSTQRAIRELQACSNRELADMGITRGTIRQAVLHGIEASQSGILTEDHNSGELAVLEQKPKQSAAQQEQKETLEQIAA